MDRMAAMEAFIRVVDTGSFSAAARQLRVGQPAISKTVAQLEARLGVKLLLRTPRRLTPTEAGQHFYERARRSIEEANEAELAARGAGAGLTGRLRFAAAVTFARLLVIPRLPLFLAVHPALTIEAVLDDRSVDLIEEGIDVALRMGDLPDSRMAARRLARARRIVVGTPEFFAGAGGAPAAPADLERYPAVVYTQRGGGPAWTFRQGAAAESVTLRETLRVTAAEGMREAVFAGLGLCVGSEWMFQPELRAGRVVEVLAGWSLPTIDLWAIFPAGRRVPAKAQAFARFVEDSIGNFTAPCDRRHSEAGRNS